MKEEVESLGINRQTFEFDNLQNLYGEVNPDDDEMPNLMIRAQHDDLFRSDDDCAVEKSSIVPVILRLHVKST